VNFEQRDVRIGALVLGALVIAGGLFVYKNAGSMTERTYPLEVRLDRMDGLTPGSDVQLKGFRVGSVERVEMRQEGKDYFFLAHLKVRDEIRLWKGTTANLEQKGVGSVMFTLQPPEPAERAVLLSAGDRIPGTAGASVSGVLERADRLIASLQSGVDALRSRLEKNGLRDLLDQPAVRRRLESLDATLSEFQSLAKESRGVMGHADNSMAGVDKAFASLDTGITQVRALLDKRGPELEQILVSLSGTLRRTETLAGKIATDDEPALSRNLEGLRRTLTSAEELLEVLKQKPNRIMWGTPSDSDRARARKAVEDRKPLPPKP
jgi:phospholipid/cholesterol/gamma-HCH transport system substrate-binding protein